MVKKVLLSMSAALALAVSANAQVAPCATDEANLRAKQFNPQIAQYEAQLEADIQRAMKKLDLSKFAKVTGLLDTTYHIPLVFHIISSPIPPTINYFYISDDAVFKAVREINDIYLKRNSDTADVIPAFKGKIRGTENYYIGKANIQFHLATKDPAGNPTRGITRRTSLLSANAGDQAKFDQWAPSSYINIWIIEKFSSSHDGAAAYAYKPGSAAGLPFYDGIIGGNQSGDINLDNTIAHELGHVLNLDHTWGSTNSPNVACGDDGVDDTPPTKGHNPNTGGNCTGVNNPPNSSTNTAMWDTICTHNIGFIQKVGIDTPITTTSVIDNSTNPNIAFTVRTEIVLRTVTIYSGAMAGSAYTIELTDAANNVLQTYSGTTVNGPDTAQVVPVNFRIYPGTYKLRFGTNPGMRRSTIGTYTRSIPGAVTVTSDTLGGRYNFFYNWQVYYGYFKLYDYAQMKTLYDTVYNKDGNKFLVDYPDTVNAQNVMDYTYCSKMFTNGQALRMRAALRSTVGGRNNLWSPENLALTGALASTPDVGIVAAFTTNRAFTCAGTAVTFTNRSWNDTATGLEWTFGSNATPSTSTITTPVSVAFTDTGWASVTLKATSKVNGAPTSNTTTVSKAIYVASNTPIDPGFYQEFNSDLKGWPIMNYTSTHTGWDIADVGFFDNKSIRFKNTDDRTGSAIYTGTADGQYADFYTPAYDLTPYATGNCNINFMGAGATRALLLNDILDTLEIAYSVNCGQSWVPFAYVGKAALANNGTVAGNFVPNWMGAWRGHAYTIPALARAGGKTFFRFRYKPQADPNNFFGITAGNNFYMDRIFITNSALGVDEHLLTEKGFILSPNPTSGNASIVVKGGQSNVTVQVTDMAGRVVFVNETPVRSNTTSITVPANNIAAKGVYMVTVSIDGKSRTEKLVVY